MEQLERIGDQHLLHTFLQNSEEHHDWNLERLFLHRKTRIDQQELSTAGRPNTKPYNQKYGLRW